MSIPSIQSAAPLTLSGKLELLRRRLMTRGSTLPSTRDLASRTTDENGKPTIDHTVIHATLNGTRTNPPYRTILELSRAFNCPPAYLLPGPDDLVSLEVYYAHEQVREALRLISDLGDTGATGLLQAARAMREVRGLPTDAQPQLAPPAAPEGRRRRLSRSEAAARSRGEQPPRFT